MQVTFLQFDQMSVGRITEPEKKRFITRNVRPAYIDSSRSPDSSIVGNSETQLTPPTLPQDSALYKLIRLT